MPGTSYVLQRCPALLCLFPLDAPMEGVVQWAVSRMGSCSPEPAPDGHQTCRWRLQSGTLGQGFRGGLCLLPGHLKCCHGWGRRTSKHTWDQGTEREG